MRSTAKTNIAPPRPRARQCASSHVAPTPVSTTTGTASCNAGGVASSIARRTALQRRVYRPAFGRDGLDGPGSVLVDLSVAHSALDHARRTWQWRGR